MSKLVKALVLSAIATGVAAVVVKNIQKNKQVHLEKDVNDAREVHTETMTQEQVQMLSDELESML